MKIFLAADHAGFELKEKVKSYLLTKDYDIEDCGVMVNDPTDDYPDFIAKAAMGVSRHPGSVGFIFGKSGAGECIVANKVKGVRAVLGFSKENILLAREHNDANMLSFGSLFISEHLVLELVDLFLSTPFSNELRHKRRINKITALENQVNNS